MSFGPAGLAAADAATADVVGIRADDLVLFHPDLPVPPGQFIEN
jgi:hypothetical protein